MRERHREARDEFKGRRGCTVNGMICSVDPTQFSRTVTLQRGWLDATCVVAPDPRGGGQVCAAAVYKYFANFSTRCEPPCAALSPIEREHFFWDSWTPPTRSLIERGGTCSRKERVSRVEKTMQEQCQRENDFEIVSARRIPLVDD